MKKFLLAVTLILGVVVSQFALIKTVEASDAYVGTWEGGWKAYVMTETYSGNDSSMSCRVKTVSPKGTVKYIDYEFSFYGDRVTFKDSTGASGVFYTDSVGQYQVENQICIAWWKIHYGKSDSSSSSGGSKSSEKVYVGMNDYGDKEVYILPDTIQDINWQGYSGFSVQVCLDNNPKSYTWYFVYKDSQWCQLMSLSEYSYPTPINSPIIKKVVEVANRYR